MAWFEALVSIVISLVPILIVFLILMDGYRTKLNSEKIIAQKVEDKHYDEYNRISLFLVNNSSPYSMYYPNCEVYL